jgi:hypothetical protein
MEVETSRTARNGFIESMDWVAPTLKIFFPAAGSCARAAVVP